MASFNRFSEEEQRWIIIGAGLSALLLLALIQLLCMFCSCGCGCGCRKNDSEQEDYLEEKVSFGAKENVKMIRFFFIFKFRMINNGLMIIINLQCSMVFIM